MPSVHPDIAVISGAIMTSRRTRLEGIAEYAYHAGWHAIHLMEPESVLQRLQQQTWSGILCFHDEQPLVTYAEDHGIPLVSTTPAIHSQTHYAAVDEEAVAQCVAEYLVKFHTPTLAYCGFAGHAGSARRFKAFSKAAGELANREVAPFFYDMRLCYQDRLAAFESWMTALSGPVALLAFDDRLARQILEFSIKLEARVPQDLKVVGVGQDELFGSLTHPTLSSVGIPGHQIGYEAARMLDELMQGKSPRLRRLLEPLPILERESSSALATDDPQLRRALEHIKKNLANSLPVQEIARASGLSPRSLHRRFRATFHDSVGNVIQNLRLQRARDELQHSRRTIEEIAQNCGYDSAASFSRAFRKTCGESPGRFRNMR